jgi:hypothetical protein
VSSSLEVERTRAAANLVIQDVETELGPGALNLIVGSDEELATELPSWAPASFRSDLYGWVFQGDGGKIGLSHREGMSWPDLVVTIADRIQEGIIEGEHWGSTFPTCHGHGGHPMDAEVVEGVASWVCHQGDSKESVTPIAIGMLGLTDG